MSDKVKLTKEQAKFLKDYTDMWTDEKIIESLIHAKENSATNEEEEVLIKLSTDTLIRALYIGYEVEQTVEEQLLQLVKENKESHDNAIKLDDRDESMWASGKLKGIKETLDIIGMKVKGINA